MCEYRTAVQKLSEVHANVEKFTSCPWQRDKKEKQKKEAREKIRRLCKCGVKVEIIGIEKKKLGHQMEMKFKKISQFKREYLLRDN